MTKHRVPLFVASLLLALIPQLPAAEGAPLRVVGDVFKNKPIPIALQGYDGAVARALAFDLEVMGCKIVPVKDAAYILTGANQGAVNGLLKDAAGNFGFNRRYNGGGLRDQAHALSNDVIKTLTGVNGIAHTRIIYKMKTARRAYEVFVADYDGHQPVGLTQDNTLVESPQWAPGNEEVFYTSWYNIGGVENTTVIRHNTQDGTRKVFARFKGLNTGGSMSPQGTIAMVLSRGVNPDVWVAHSKWEFLKDTKGVQLQRVSRTPAAENGPAWTPDGRWLYFATRSNGRRMLVKVPAQGGDMVRVPTPGAINPSDPAFSPDGKMLAFISQTGKFFNLYVMPVAGGAPQLITAGEDPSWAPNSRNIIFTRRGVDKRQLAIVDVPTKQVKIITSITGSASQPDWQK